MIHCGRLTTGQIIKILGVFQLIGAIIITCVGITVVVDFIEIDHEKQSNGEIAVEYVDMHWTVTYGAAIWMGLVMAIAGAFGCFADVKPHKSKYVYGTMVANAGVIIAAILLVVFSYDGVTWFDTCQYTYHKSTVSQKRVFTRSCSTNDKSKGRQMYWTIFVVTLLMIPLTICMLIMIGIANKVLFEDGICDRSWTKSTNATKTRHMSNSNNNIPTKKGAHHFDKEMTMNSDQNPKPSAENVSRSDYTKPSVYC